MVYKIQPLFTLKQFENFPNLSFNGTQIQFVDDHKHLGLTLSKNGKWHLHIDKILNSAAKVIGIMRKLKFTLNRTALNQIYMCYVLPILGYSSIVWDGCTAQDSNALEKLQDEAAGIVTGLTKSVSLENLYRECWWKFLFERRNNHKLCFMYKSVNGQVPSYKTDIIAPLVRETTNYPLRNQNSITVPFCRTELYRKSCIPSSITRWNNLDGNLRNSSSLCSFKNALKQVSSNINNVPLYYIKGDRFLSVIHARIRNNRSNLYNDLYLNH